MGIAVVVFNFKNLGEKARAYVLKSKQKAQAQKRCVGEKRHIDKKGKFHI
jgi:hypothetical protein